jgi:hypothetical protein
MYSLIVFLTKSKTLKTGNDLVNRSCEQPFPNGEPSGIQCCGLKYELSISSTMGHVPMGTTEVWHCV